MCFRAEVFFERLSSRSAPGIAPEEEADVPGLRSLYQPDGGAADGPGDQSNSLSVSRLKEFHDQPWSRGHDHGLLVPGVNAMPIVEEGCSVRTRGELPCAVVCSGPLVQALSHVAPGLALGTMESDCQTTVQKTIGALIISCLKVPQGLLGDPHQSEAEQVRGEVERERVHDVSPREDPFPGSWSRSSHWPHAGPVLSVRAQPGPRPGSDF